MSVKRARYEVEAAAMDTVNTRVMTRNLQELAQRHVLASVKLTDQKIALDIAGFAGIPTQDARGNILQSIWSKHYDTSNVGLLLERNDVRVLLLKQLEQQIKEQKDSINMLEQSDVLCKWILNFTQSWENEYNASKQQHFDIGQVVLAAMQETYFIVESYLEEFCPLKPSMIRKRIRVVMQSAKHVRDVRHNIDFTTDDAQPFDAPDLVQPSASTASTASTASLDTDGSNGANGTNKTKASKLQLHFFGEEAALIRFLFRNEYFGLQLRRVAGKVLKKQEVCNKPGAYSARIQRNDITQEVDWALDHFCKMLDDDVMEKCRQKLQNDDQYVLRHCIDHRGFPKTEDTHSTLIEGLREAERDTNGTSYLHTGDPGRSGGQTYTGTGDVPTLEQYEAIFGPAGRDVKQDSQRHKRHQRWHLPDALKGHNQFLTDRVDGLITDATNSPFTRNILPYKYLENPDQKLKWNVYSFDEGIASRVPYEAAARVLPQTKKSFAGYTVRHGLAIAMEHNFMMSAAGRENFKNQLTQLVGSIQLTNDLDVHVALLQAPSYQKHMSEKYYDQTKTVAQASRQYCDLFGIMQKTPNALDYLIEDAKTHLKTWGSQPPTFLMCNGKLTTQLTMLPEKTNYLTNGPDGLQRLAQGPDLPSYRGLSIIHGKKFSLDTGTAPRDLLRRKVRVAEYYRIPWKEDIHKHVFEFYDQSRDTMFRVSWKDLWKQSRAQKDAEGNEWHSLTTITTTTTTDTEVEPAGNDDRTHMTVADMGEFESRPLKARRTFGAGNEPGSNPSPTPVPSTPSNWNSIKEDLFILRPNIEHEMLSVIMGRGGTQELGCTFWGQTELSCYDDAQHGIWGMSYKYHERAMVTNERNLIRVYDVAFDGYNGGMDQKMYDWNSPQSREDFKQKTHDRRAPYNGPSMLVMAVPHVESKSGKTFPNPLIFCSAENYNIAQPEEASSNVLNLVDHDPFNFAAGANCADNEYTTAQQQQDYKKYLKIIGIQDWCTLSHTSKSAGEHSILDESEVRLMAFEGTMIEYSGAGHVVQHTHGSGHLGPSHVGVASVREGRGITVPTAPISLNRLV